MSNLWFEITAQVPPSLVEEVSDLVRVVAPGGITVEEPVDILGPEEGFRVRGDEPVLIRAYLPSSELGAVLTEDLRRSMEPFPSVELTARPIFEQDWAVSWREFFGVVDTGGRAVIVPSWIEHEVGPGQVAIRLDPGQAFGTGHHETTRLCLAALDSLARAGIAMLDVGTGSGVLSIAAVKLGIPSVTAIDIDPVAAEIARRNCDENGIGAEVSISAGVLTLAHRGRYELALSNISTDANIGLAAAFGAVVKPRGDLVLSGILAPDSRRVVAAMEPHGFRLAAMAHERDWCLIHLRKQ
ncbi:MAG: 50S ribosomal protein L11 methyltransferase [Chloroflexi bacterium]|nr:50S ribosomal protein L11 methyltransferase [Chloroflexota bacterium]